MTTPYPATHAMVSSGTLLFADGSNTWDPSQFPTLPPLNIALTAQGNAGPSTISTLTLTNSNYYEPFEPIAIRPQLVKQVQLNSSGLLTFEESKVGFVSTIAASFLAPVSQFTQSSLGGAAIQDVVSGTPDTLTNALGKLDAWIANAFLLQPPAVNAAEVETNSMWGGVRWTTFNTYSVLDKFVPYVNSIVLIIGDPTTADYCTLEITDATFFPYKTYTDGLSPQQNPLVSLRIFTDFLPTGEQTYYTKRQLQTQCIRIVSESGDATFPASGNVVAVSPTNGTSTYTTLSLFLPMLPIAYPNGTPVPVRIAFLNETSGTAHVAVLSTQQATTGGPSPPVSVALVAAAAGELEFQVVRPQYSDATAQTPEPFFSSYVTSYTYEQLAVANVAQVGFRYGTPDPTQPPSTLSTYVGNTYTQSFVAWNSTQSIALTGIVPNLIQPGVVWSTSVAATNAAMLPGDAAAGPVVSTLFPVDPAPTILNMRLVATDLTQVAPASTIFTTTYGVDGWTVGPSVGHDVLFLSTVGPLAFRTASIVQYNDASYPGDRTPIQVAVRQTDSVGQTGTPVTLTTTTTDNDYELDTIFAAAANQAQIGATLSDTQSTFGYTHYFYAADLSGAVTVSTITTATQSVRLALTNTAIPSFAGTPASQTVTSPSYVFSTEFSAPPSTTGVRMTNITSTIFISGLATVTPYSQFLFDMSGANFAYRYTASTLASAQLLYNSNAVGPLAGYSNNVQVYDGASPVSTLPFPVNTVLTLSSLAVHADAGLYTDPNDPGVLTLVASASPANPTPDGQHIAVSTTIQEYVDTVSYPYLANFTNATGSNGARILSLVPNVNDLSTSQYFMDDGVDMMGSVGVGLDTTVSTFFAVQLPSTVQINSTILYDHTESISSIYTDYYSRELLYTNGYYIHPAGFNFTQFNDGFQYPNFTYDLYNDTTFGYRYASFAFEGPALASPTPYSYVNVRVVQPSLGSTIQSSRDVNNWWPNTLTNQLLVSSMKVRMHYKLIGTYNIGVTQPIETAWVNCLKQVDFYNFDDQIYDMGATYAVTVVGSDIEYKMLINRRYYQKTTVLVRVGIAQDGGQYTGQPITFQSMTTRLSDA
jgi:hypothetical protein